MRKKIFLVMLLGFIVVLLTIQGYAFYEEKPERERQGVEKAGIVQLTESKKPEFAPGQLTIKFKPELGAQAGKVFKEGRPFSSVTGTDMLDNLNKKHKVKRIERIFKDLEAKGKARGKDFITTAEDREEIKTKFSQRTKRAPQHPKIPDLENIYLLELEDSKADIFAITEEYKKDPNVVYAEPNYIRQAQMVPNDPYYHSSGSWGQPYDDLWGLKIIQAEQAWDISQGAGVIVAVVDTGIDYNHQDITPNIWINTDEIAGNGIDDDRNGYIDDVRGYDFAYNDSDPIDGHGHGTHVAGTIAAVGNNNLGIIGVAPRAKVMAVKGLDNSGSGYDDWLANALGYAANNGADVINNSWGGAGSSLTIEDAVNYAYSLGCVVVAAAGNSNDNVSCYTPANILNVITVASSDHNDKKSDFSNWGYKIDVAAPGGDSSSVDGSNRQGRNILSLRATGTDMYNDGLCIINSNYYRARGTSMACPHVSGLAALVLARQPTFTNEDVRQVLRISADDVESPGFDVNTGAGRINASSALMVDSVLWVKIITPANSSALDPQADSVTISGTAAGPDFKQYELFFAIRSQPSIWTPIGSAVFASVENGLLGTWNIKELPPVGSYILRLVATTNTGIQFNHMIEVYLERHNIRQITNNPARQQLPAISEGRIVWEDFRNGNWDIYLYDLTTNTERQIVINSARQFFPDISGDRIVWQDLRNGNWDIYLYDLTTNTERQITTNTATQYFPVISGNRIVWEDYRNGNPDIYLYDLTTNTERQITTNTASQCYPAISGDRIVWEDSRYATPRIFLYDLTTNIERMITLDKFTIAYSPVISGNRIVWKDNRKGNYDIYLYDLTTNTERQITTNSAGQINPVISGNRIVWEDYRNGNPDIYLYDLTTNTERQITAEYQNQQFPAVFGNCIVWQDERNGLSDIYLYEVDTTPPSAPTVIDEGKFTNKKDQLYASWSSEDKESGIAEYQYRITQDSTTGTVIRDWTSTGKGNYVTAGGLSLTVGKTYYFGVKAQNGEGLWSAGGYSDGITVVNNNPPVLAPIGNKTTDENVKLEFTISANDPDGDALTYSASNLPAGAIFSPTTRTFSWTPTYAQAGIYGNISFAVSDSIFSDSETITITVNNVNRPPVLNPIGNKTVKANSLLTFTISGSDPDGDVLTYSATNLPSGATFNPSTRKFSWKPKRNQVGVYANVTLKVSDGQLIDSEAITITVTK